MIEKMKKATVIVLDKRRREAVEQMRRAGVLHIETLGAEGGTLETLNGQRSTVERALFVLSATAESAGNALPAGVAAAASEERAELVAECEQIVAWSEEIRGAREERERLERDAARLEPWGDFAFEDLDALRQRGVEITLHAETPKQFARLEAEGLFEVGRTSEMVYFAQIRRAGEPRLELDEVTLPGRNLAALREEIAGVNSRIAEHEASILERLPSVPRYRSVQEELEAAIEFEQVHNGMAEEGALAYITGFVPESEVDRVRQAAADGKWGLLLRDPSDEDSVPTRIRNPKPVRIIQPVFDLLGTIPGYHELDISSFFLLFFTGFFAMIIGDAGYGVILLGIALFASFKVKKAGKPLPLGLVLLTLLSGATIVWGAITGTWFGYPGFAELPFLRWMVIPSIYSFNPQSAEVVQGICFIIGTTHLVIAHGWNFLRELRSKPKVRAVAQLGWLVMVLGLYHLVLTVVLGQPLPPYALSLIGGGFGLVVLFSMQKEGQNFFKGILLGVANMVTLALDSVSAFSDIISYIRLFAVGLATVEIAVSFNNMAAEIAASGTVGAVAAVLVLFLGHTLNLAMAALAVVVHGVRLNMLEFSSHLGMEWSGVEYRPFQKSS